MEVTELNCLFIPTPTLSTLANCLNYSRIEVFLDISLCHKPAILRIMYSRVASSHCINLLAVFTKVALQFEQCLSITAEIFINKFVITVFV